MSRILVSGSLAYDRIMNFPGRFRDHFLPEKLHALSVSFAIDKLTEGFGGTAGNIAYNLSLLGEKPTLCAAAGHDFGRYKKWLIDHRIGIENIAVVQDKATSGAYVMTDKDDSQISAFYFGAGEEACDVKIDTAKVALAIIAAGNISDMLGVPARCREASVPFFSDSGQQITALSAEQLREHMEGAAVLFGNDYEMELVTKKTGWDVKEVLEHVGTVVVTKGADGSMIITKEGEENVKAVPAKAVDPTGAGDAYRAGFAKAYLAKRPLRECAMLGSAVAAYAVEKYGTQNHRFTISELKERYEKTYGETLSL